MPKLNPALLATASKLTQHAVPIAVSTLIALEGFGSKPYFDSAGVLTDCYGNTHQVSQGHIRSQGECKVLLTKEVQRIAQRIAQDDVGAADRMNPNQLAAMISWAYNVGLGAYSTSTARKKMLAGDYTGMCYELPRWNMITVFGHKVVLPGLNNRRAKELALCLS